MKQQLHRIGVLHLTDLHSLDSSKSKSRIGDIKDKAVGAALTKELTYNNCAQIFFENIQSSIGDYNVDAIAYTGDLGWQNSKSSIESGADYLLKLAKKFDLKSDRIVICPGNHDVDRKAKMSAALSTFQKVCKKNGFIFAKWKEPACLKINGLPIIAFNSCLGATEHACHGVPKEVWKETRDYIKRFEKIMENPGIDPNLKCMSQAMDIPTIGKSQRNLGLDYLRKEKKNCVIVLTHHNPLPTPTIEGRPYANLVDAGVLIAELMDNRRVFVLHGHTHCDSALCVKSPESSDPGLFVSLGSHGLHGLDGNASATYLQLLVDKDYNFLAATCFRLTRRGSTLFKSKNFYIFDITHPIRGSTLNIDVLQRKQKLMFDEVARKLKRKPDCNLAVDLLQNATQETLSIDRICLENLKDWEITRN